MINMKAYAIRPANNQSKIIYATEENVKQVVDYCLQKYGACVIEEIPESWLEESIYESY